jgi:hypothetical protein
MLDIKKKTGVSIRFHVRMEIGDGKTSPPESVAKEVNSLLKDIKEGLKLR